MNANERLSDLIDFAIEQYTRKNKDYGNSFTKNYQEYGLISSAIRLDDKINRFIRLASGNKQNVADESMRDTMLDCATYSLMTIMEIQGHKDDANMPELFTNMCQSFYESFSSASLEDVVVGFQYRYKKYGVITAIIDLDEAILLFKRSIKIPHNEYSVVDNLTIISTIAFLVVMEIDMATEEAEAKQFCDEVLGRT